MTKDEPPLGPDNAWPRNLPLREGCQEHWGWNKHDKSHEVRLYGPRHHIAHFHPNWSNGTAGVRGTQALGHGLHYWEVHVSQRIFGTSMMFGVGTERARIHADAFVNLLGEDDSSWGLSHKGLLWHGGRWRHYCRAFRENEPTVMGVLYDGTHGTLAFYKDGVGLGMAFTGLHMLDEDVFPIVCSTAAKTEMTLGVALRGFHSLQDRCRAVITRSATTRSALGQLPLPARLLTYLGEALPT